MPTTLPAIIYLGGILPLPWLRGKIRQAYLLVVGFVGLINVFFLKPQTSWKTSFLGFDVIFLQADRISLFVGYIFVFIGFFAFMYALKVEDTWHHVAALAYVGSSLGAVFAGDLLTLYLFWEIMAVASAGLVFLNNTEESRQAAYRYLLMHFIGGAVLFGGIMLNYMQTGSLAVAPMKPGLAFNLVLFGVGMNAAFVLLHTWLPDAYPMAPITGSVFMSVYTTKTAVYALARLAPGWDFVAYMGAGMAVFGVIMALIQSNARKLLSYHIVSQVGYMVAAIGLGGAVGVNGGLLHLFNHILYKALLFMTIGAAIHVTGKENLTELGGLARKMPVTTTAAIIASLSISGFPLFNGFISKSMIFKAAHGNEVIDLMLELAAVGTLLSFLKFTYFGFIRQNKENEAQVKEVPPHMTIAMGSVAFICFLVGVAPALITPILPFALPAADLTFYTFNSIIGVLQIIIVTTILFFVANKVFEPHKRITFDFDWFYIQAGKGLQYVAEGVNWFNNSLEAATQKIVPFVMSLKPAVSKINELASRLLFAFFVDIWLLKPVTPSVAQLLAEQELRTKGKQTDIIDDIASLGEKTSILIGRFDVSVVDRLVGGVAVLGEKISHFFGWFDLTFVDGIVNGIAVLAEKISYFFGRFDLKVVDGVVNGVAWVTKKAGKELRPMQTGYVQNYGLAMVVGALTALIIFGLMFYGILTLT